MLQAMLEVAKAQSNMETVADALAMAVDSHNLTASTEVLNEKTCKLYIENASAEEVVSLVNLLLDQDEVTASISVLESACGGCAVIVFDDEDDAVLAGLEEAGIVLETAAKPIEEDDEDEVHIVEEDDDVDLGNDDEDDAEVDDPNIMKVLHSEEAFKLATRLQSMACGNNKAEFPHFMTKLDRLLQEFRNRSGYAPSEGETAAMINDLFIGSWSDTSSELFVEEAKKKGKGFRSGRGGFLSAYMRFVGKRGDDLADAWDSLDIPMLTRILSEVGEQLLVKVEEERIKRGLEPTPDEINVPEEEERPDVDVTEEAQIEVVTQ